MNAMGKSLFGRLFVYSYAAQWSMRNINKDSPVGSFTFSETHFLAALFCLASIGLTVGIFSNEVHREKLRSL